MPAPMTFGDQVGVLDILVKMQWRGFHGQAHVWWRVVRTNDELGDFERAVHLKLCARLMTAFQ